MEKSDQLGQPWADDEMSHENAEKSGPGFSIWSLSRQHLTSFDNIVLLYEFFKKY